MNPANFFRKNREEDTPQEYYFALEVVGSQLKGAIWTVEEEKVKVVSFTPPIDWSDENELDQKIDEIFEQAISLAKLSQDERPRKVIFGLPFDWVEGEKIVGTKLELLRVVCQRLGIRPVGFVVTTEAIVKYLKAVQGTAPSLILVCLDNQELELVLVRAGRVAGRPVVKRSQKLADDIAEGLARVQLGEEEVLPARILLYGNESNLEEKVQEVVDFPWLEESFPFLHLPKVEKTDENFDIRAVTLAGGAEVIGAMGEKVVMDLPESEVETKPEEDDEEQELDSFEESGEEEVETEEPASAFGFKKQSLPVTTGSASGASGEVESRAISPEPSIRPVESSQGGSGPGRHLRLNWRRLWSGFRLGWRGRQSSKFGAKKKVFFIGLGLILLLVAGGGVFAAWWYLPKAEITLFVKPHLLEKTFQVTLERNLETADEEEFILPAQVISTKLEKESSRATTGKKLIGEKAQGEVIIYNRTITEKDLPAGTILVGPESLSFTLNEDVVVASESAGEDYVRIPGKVVVGVTAVEIGSESNLASGTEFEVSKYSKTDLVAKNEADFSGGSSREVQVVAEEDLEILKADLVEELKSQAEGELSAKLDQGQILVAESIESQVSQEDFEPELGAEAEVVSARLTVAFEALAYRQSEFDKFVQERVSSSVPSGYRYQDGQKEVDFKLDEVKGDQAIFQVKVWANLLPVVPVDQITESLLGKTPVKAEFYLQNLGNGVVGYAPPVLTPKYIPEKLKRYPRQPERIIIEVRSE